MPKTDDGRLHELDGLRGWAAFIVLLGHVFDQMFGALYPAYRIPALHFFFDGHLAVIIFFILSGQALSISFIRNRDETSLLRLVVKRYPRLFIPVFFSCLLVFVVMLADLNYNQEASVIVDREDWLGSWLHFRPTTESFLYDVFIGSFFTTDPHYNKFLWTMFYELQGSFYVFAALLIYPMFRYPEIFVGMVSIILLHFYPQIACFFFGMLLSHLRVEGYFKILRSSALWQKLGYIGIAGLIAADNLVYVLFNAHFKLGVIIGVGIVLLVQTNRLFGEAMKSGLSQFLGKISFPLYLVHFTVIVSPLSMMVVFAEERGLLTFSGTMLIGTLAVMLSILAAVLFLPVERLTRMVCDFFAKQVFPPGRPETA